MKAAEEVLKTLKALEEAGFKPVDAVFKGAIAVMDKETLNTIQELADKGEAVGSIMILYQNPDGQLRTLEIPIGTEEEQQEQGAQQ